MRSLAPFCAVGALAVAGVAGASGAGADAYVALGIVVPPAPVVGKPFSVEVRAGNAGPERTRFTVRLALDGLRPLGTLALACDDLSERPCIVQEAGPGFAASETLRLVADRPGRYTVVARVADLTAPDPNAANNEVGLGIAVRSASALAAVRFRLAPARPRAGGRVVASFRVVDRVSGVSVRLSSARCRANVGSARARAIGATAFCTVSTPASARGRILRGVLVAIAPGARVSRAFAVRLG